MTTDTDGYTTIKINRQYDVTVTPSGVATVWQDDDTLCRAIPFNVLITYDYGDGDHNQYTVSRDGRAAVEFIITAWLNSRRIINVRIAD